MPRFDDSVFEQIDTDKRYDIYVSETQNRIIVYRGAMFRGKRRLSGGGEFDRFSEFFEIEQSNGQSVFVGRFALVKFCETGTELTESQIMPPLPRPNG